MPPGCPAGCCNPQRAPQGEFFLRREIYCEGPREAWSYKHRLWLASIKFAHQASRATLADYLNAHDVLIARGDQVEVELSKLALSARCAPTVARLRCLRGIDTLTALGPRTTQPPANKRSQRPRVLRISGRVSG